MDMVMQPKTCSTQALIDDLRRAHKPAEQQVVVELLQQQTLRSDPVEGLEQ